MQSILTIISLLMSSVKAKTIHLFIFSAYSLLSSWQNTIHQSCNQAIHRRMSVSFDQLWLTGSSVDDSVSLHVLACTQKIILSCNVHDSHKFSTSEKCPPPCTNKYVHRSAWMCACLGTKAFKEKLYLLSQDCVWGNGIHGTAARATTRLGSLWNIPLSSDSPV